MIAKDGLHFSCTDDCVEPGAEYRYIVEVETDDSRVLLFQTEILSVPGADLALLQNHPNPFNPSTTISYYLPESGPVTLEIYDVSGRLVRRLLDREMKESGIHGTAWDGQDAKGHRVQSGLYFYRIEAGKRSLSKKMVLLR